MSPRSAEARLAVARAIRPGQAVVVRVAHILFVLLVAAACDSAITATGDTTLSLRVTVADGVSSASIDQGRIRIEGPTPRTLTVTPGTTQTIEGLLPGTYTVVLEGLTAGEVETWGERTGVTVTAGNNTTVTVTMSSFIPTLGTVPGEVTAGEDVTVSFSPVTGATAYIVEWADNAAFTGAQQTEVSVTTATVNLSAQGTYHIRVRARNRFGSLGVPSASVQVTAGVGLIPIADVRAAAEGTEVRLEGVVTWHPPYDPRVLFVQDVSGGIAVFDVNSPAADIGDRIRIRGERTTFEGEIQVGNLSEFMNLGPVGEPSPRPVTGADISAGMFQGELVTLVGTVDQIEVLSFDNQMLLLRDESGNPFAAWVDSRTGTMPTDWQVGWQYFLTGVVGTDNDVAGTGVDDVYPHRLETRGPDDRIVIGGPPAINEIVVTPSVLNLGYVGASMIIYGTPFDANGQPVPGFTQIFFSSSNTGVATVDSEGRLTAVAPGTATVTITDGFGRSGTMQVTVGGAFGPVRNSLGHAYAATNAPMTWFDAQALARSTGGYLVSVNNLQENGFLTNAFHAPLTEQLWIGLSDLNVEDLWEWTDGSPPSPGATTPGNGGFASWGPGEPNQAGEEDCAHYDGGFNGQWNDLSCDASLRAIAEWPALGPTVIENVTYYRGRRYAITRDELTWFEARNLAESLGGHLATVDDGIALGDIALAAAENQFLTDSYFVTYGAIWLGLTDIAQEGSFRWVTGQTLSGFINWDAGQPDNANNNEDCVTPWTLVSGAMAWNDLDCAATLRAVIEWDYLKQ